MFDFFGKIRNCKLEERQPTDAIDIFNRERENDLHVVVEKIEKIC